LAEESKKRRTKIARQKLALRASLWPDMDEGRLWNREKSDGWLSVPRSMPLLMQIMDNLSKGKPVSSTYIDLWCRAYDDSFIVANKHREMAFFSGFTGERAERTWASRMRILAELGFIEIAEGPNGPISYVIIYNPYQVVLKHFQKGSINAATFNALKQRMIEIGAQDLEETESSKPKKAQPTMQEILNRPIKRKKVAPVKTAAKAG
jgi:hypothetical protein